jgi:hypothetical protein
VFPDNYENFLNHYQTPQRELWPKMRERMYQRKSFGILIFETEEIMKNFTSDLNKTESLKYTYQTHHVKENDFSDTGHTEFPSVFLLPQVKIKNKDMREFIKTCVVFYKRTYAITLDSDRNFLMFSPDLTPSVIGSSMYSHASIDYFVYVNYFETASSMYYTFV